MSNQANPAALTAITIACSLLLCANEPPSGECVSSSQSEALQIADIVFRGKVVEIEDVELGPMNRDDKEGLVRPSAVSNLKAVTFLVDRAWKGAVAQSVTVIAFSRVSMGGAYQFVKNSEYVVYALDDVDQAWLRIRTQSSKHRVYSVGVSCPLRIRNDIQRESVLLGKGRIPKSR